MRGDQIDAFEARFNERVNRRGRKMPHMRSCCWEWMGAKNAGGYGLIEVDGRNVVTHRVSWFLATNKWPDKLVLHHCDNPACVCKLHLYQGTHADNTRDMVMRGRQRQVQHWSKKLQKVESCD